jgi:ABC-2 type transport system ATP-binding protein
MLDSRAMVPTADGDTPIRVERVSKSFERTIALDRVTLEVRRGEIFGLLGPNGAGKTTLIRAVLDIIKPDSGRVLVFGRPFASSDRNRIGYLPEERGLYPRQPVGAVLEYLGALKGMSAADARRRTDEWLERFGLGDARANRIDQLSKGNQQKVQIAATLLARPAVVVLDEPLSGLDPVSARAVHGVIKECAAEGRAVLLSTHQMGMVEALCTRVFMIARGRGVLDGNLQEIKRQYSGAAILVRSSADYQACPLVASARDEGLDRPTEVQLAAGVTPDAFLQWLVTSGARVEHFERVSMPLEDIFVRVAGEAESAA